MRRKISVILSLLLLVPFTSLANLDFRMSADTYSLTVGGSAATITIEAFIEGTTVGSLNGLNLWQLDMAVDNDGVIEVIDNSWTFSEPAPVDNGYSGVWLINGDAGKTGDIYSMNAGIQTWGDSDAAIGGYMPIATFQIQAVAAGTTTYAIGDFSGVGWFGFVRDDDPAGMPTYDSLQGNMSFTNANNTFTVIPEPTTLIMLSLMSIMGLRRKSLK